MTVLTLIRAELARLVATPLARLALVALMLVPVLYGGLYLWANRDPYAGLDRVPAALVVADHGRAATEVATEILDGHAFDWHEVDAADAAAGVESGRYDFSVTLPAGFSAALDSLHGTDPATARIRLVTNDANGYLSSTIAEQATERVRAAIAAKVGREAAGRFLDAMSGIRTQLGDAAGGASRLADGTAQATSGARALSDGTASLAAGAARVADGTAQLAAKGDQAAALGNELAAQLPALRAALAQQLAAQGLTTTQIDRVLTQLDPVVGKADAANQRLQTLAGQVDRLAAGAGQVATGAQQAHDGAAALTSGLGDLGAGATRLRDGLGSGLAQLPDTTAAQRSAVAAAIGDPVSVSHAADTSAGGYGAGLAPFFVSLAAWIGIYALFLIVTPISRRALSAVDRPVRVTLAAWLTPGILGVIQMAAVFLVLTLGLGFSVANAAGAFGIMALASLSFAAIILALNVWLGSVGQFLGLVLMVVQLVTAGGTFPWQTLPAPLAALHPVLPMSAAVDGIRCLMYGGSGMTALADAGLLAIWLLGALAITTVAAVRMTRRRTLRDLRPSLIG